MLDRYIAREVLGAWLLGVGWFASLWYALVVLSAIARLASKVPVTPSQIVLLMALEIPRSVALTMPMGMLYGALMAFARLTNDGELNAMLTSGVGFHRLMPPVLALGVVGSVATLVLNETVVPPAERARARIEAEIKGEMRSQEQQRIMLREPSDMFRPAERIISAERFIPGSDTFIKPSIFEFRRSDLRQITSADRGESLKSRGEDWWVLSGNVKVVRYFRNQVSVVQTPKQLEVRLGKTPLQIRTAAHRTDPDEMNYRELWEYYHMMLRTPGTTQRQINELIVHLNNKIALPMACLAMCFLGPPMVLRRQRTSGSLGLGMSFLMIVGYFLVWNIMTLLGKMGTINPSLSSWIANVVSVIVGTALVYRASR